MGGMDLSFTTYIHNVGNAKINHPKKNRNRCCKPSDGWLMIAVLAFNALSYEEFQPFIDDTWYHLISQQNIHLEFIDYFPSKVYFPKKSSMGIPGS